LNMLGEAPPEQMLQFINHATVAFLNDLPVQLTEPHFQVAQSLEVDKEFIEGEMYP